MSFILKGKGGEVSYRREVEEKRKAWRVADSFFELKSFNTNYNVVLLRDTDFSVLTCRSLEYQCKVFPVLRWPPSLLWTEATLFAFSAEIKCSIRGDSTEKIDLWFPCFFSFFEKRYVNRNNLFDFCLLEIERTRPEGREREKGLKIVPLCLLLLRVCWSMSLFYILRRRISSQLSNRYVFFLFISFVISVFLKYEFNLHC